MASVASQLIQEVTAHAQSDSLEDAREICGDGTFRIIYVHCCCCAKFVWLAIEFAYCLG